MNPRTLLLPLSALALSACIVVVDEDGMSFGNGYSSGPEGSGVSAKDAREVGTFEAVSLECSADVRIEVGPARSVTVTCDDDLFEYVDTEVERGRLIIDVHGNPRFRSGLEVVVTAPSLEAASIAGSGDVIVTGVEASSFDASIAGSGDLRVSGTADRVEASVSGSGDLRLQDLRSSVAEVTISGSGTVRVHATKVLEASISGSGDVIYSGNPERQVSVSGSGSVRHN